MRQLSAETLDHAYEEFQNELEFQAAHLPEHDLYVRAFSAAMLHLLEHDSDVAATMREVVKARLDKGNASATYLSHLTLRACQRVFWFGFMTDPHFQTYDAASYPIGYGDREKWLADLPRIILSEDEFLSYVRTRDLQSNIPDRYTSFKLLGQLYGNRFGVSPSILDVGCSADLGLKLLDKNSGLFVPTIHRAYDGDEIAELPVGLVEALHSKVTSGARIGESVGVDKTPPVSLKDDNDTFQWIFACSLTPSEYMDKERKAQFYNLLAYKPEGVHFQQADFAEDGVTIEVPSGIEGFNMATFCTVIYQIPTSERDKVIANAKRHLLPNGIIVVQDFVNVDPDDPHNLVFPEHWFYEEYGYRTLVLDMQNEEVGFQEVFRWRNGRCHDLAPNVGAACLQQLIG